MSRAKRAMREAGSGLPTTFLRSSSPIGRAAPFGRILVVGSHKKYYVNLVGDFVAMDSQAEMLYNSVNSKCDNSNANHRVPAAQRGAR